MTSKHAIAGSALVVSVICAANPANAAAPDGLVVTQMADPDPGFVAPRPDKRTARASHKNADENPTLDQAFENLGRVTGALAHKMQPQYQPTDADLKAAQERLRQKFEERMGSSGN